MIPSNPGSLAAIDLETSGLDFSDPSQYITVLGWADSSGCFAFDFRKLSTECHKYIVDRLLERRLTSFNVHFDGGFLLKKYGRWFNWEMCSYGLFMQVATESYPGQHWGLKNLQQDVLGYPTHKDWVPEALKKHGLSKDDMPKLVDYEPEDFIKYCALDAEAHWQGYFALAEDIDQLQGCSNIVKYHQVEFMNELKLLVEAQYLGIPVNVPKLMEYQDRISKQIEEGLTAFYGHRDVSPYIEEFNTSVRKLHIESEPKKFRADGKTTAAWEKWKNEVEVFKNTNFFNVASSDHLRWLFYNKCGYPVRKYTDHDTSPLPATDKECLLFFGDAGKLLFRTKKLITELRFVKGCLNRVRDIPSSEEYWNSYYKVGFRESR